MKTVIYVRVSTGGQTYEQQVGPCVKFCELRELGEYKVFSEIESTRKARPVFLEVLELLKQGKYDNLVVWRFDRAWRTSRQFIMDFDMLMARGIHIHSIMEGLDCSTPLGRAMAIILVALAELERTNISIATKQRLQALKGMDKTLGRPKGSGDKHKRKSTGYKGNINATKKRGGKRRPNPYLQN